MISAKDAVDFLTPLLPNTDDGSSSVVIVPCIGTKGPGTMIRVIVTHQGESADAVVLIHPDRQLDLNGMDFLVHATANAIKKLGEYIQLEKMKKSAKNN